jgi:hypothetical protein
MRRALFYRLDKQETVWQEGERGRRNPKLSKMRGRGRSSARARAYSSSDKPIRALFSSPPPSPKLGLFLGEKARANPGSNALEFLASNDELPPSPNADGADVVSIQEGKRAGEVGEAESGGVAGFAVAKKVVGGAMEMGGMLGRVRGERAAVVVVATGPSGTGSGAMDWERREAERRRTC